MKQALQSFICFFKNETVLYIAGLLALISAFFVTPSVAYLQYIDFRVLSLLFCLMLVVAGFQSIGLFGCLGSALLSKVHTTRQLTMVLSLLCFFSSMFITNDVALLTFVPFGIMILTMANLEKLLIPVIVLQTIAAKMQETDAIIGGFNAYVTSNVISAAGVSSSASFEMLLCSMLNALFNESRMDNVAYAHIGKYAENKYWDKASGLLDQMACAVGGLITIDFVEPMTPVVEKIDFDFQAQNHSLIIVQTGKGHADLSAEYSSIPEEMKKVAKYFGKDVLAQVSEEKVIEHLPEVRKFAGDRAVLRALHFFE